MALMDKIAILNEIETRFYTVLVSADMNKALGIVSDVLTSYDIALIKPKEFEHIDDLLQAYISALQIEGRSQKTIERYQYVIKKLLLYAGVQTRGISVYHMRSYLSSEKDRGISDITLEGYRQIYSAYFGWLHREGLISSNPTANLGAIKCRKKIKTIYSEIDIELLRSHCSCVRDKAIIDFLSSTGCRISEMTQLNRDDIDFTNRECKVLGKGDKERTVYLSQVACMTLRNYLKTRNDAYSALFVGKGTNRIAPHGVRAMLSRLADKLNMENVHPHKFRRTLATNLIRHGMPIQDVAYILGHDKLDTTLQYVVIDKSEIKHAYQKYV